MANDKSQIQKPRAQIVRWVYRSLARVDVAAILIVIVLLLATLGSCFPQLSPSVAADPGRMAQWEAGVRARYGGMTDGLVAGGVFRWFRSPVFLVPLALLAGATLVCTLDRWRGIWRRAFYQPVRCSDAALDTAPHTARLSTSPAVDLAAVAREGLERRGFRVRTTEVVTTNHPRVYLRGDRNRLAPLATLVTHLAVLLLLLGAALSSGYGWREEIAIGPGETAEVGHGSGLALRNEGFAIERYADGSVAGYEAEVIVIDGGREATRGTVRVGEPLTYGLVGLVLQGYAEAPGGTSVALLAVRDPGYGPVVAAGLLLLLGLTVSSNFPHCWVHARIDPDGTLRLAGRADRRACDFGREFTALAGEIGSLVAGEREDTG
jgi:cytochrome c biogenesis protein ResB